MEDGPLTVESVVALEPAWEKSDEERCGEMTDGRGVGKVGEVDGRLVHVSAEVLLLEEEGELVRREVEMVGGRVEACDIDVVDTTALIV